MHPHQTLEIFGGMKGALMGIAQAARFLVSFEGQADAILHGIRPSWTHRARRRFPSGWFAGRGRETRRRGGNRSRCFGLLNGVDPVDRGLLADVEILRQLLAALLAPWS
jgi:hypothetical protein